MSKVVIGSTCMLLLVFCASLQANGASVKDGSDLPTFTYHVTIDADADCSDFVCDLQAALDAAELDSGHSVIRVAQGTYIENFSYEPTDDPGDLILEGGWDETFSVRTLDPTNTVLDGDTTGRVLTLDHFDQDLSGNIVVEGFTITYGYAAGMGGGIRAFTRPPGAVELRSNIIEENEAETNGGGFAIGSYDTTAQTEGLSVVSDSIVRYNFAVSDEEAKGGGGYVDGAVTIYNTLIYGNELGDQSLIGVGGGGLFLTAFDGDILLVNNTIADNFAYPAGGGVYLRVSQGSAWDIVQFDLYNNIITGNTNGARAADDIYNGISATVPAPGNSLVVSHCDYHQLTDAPDTVSATLTANIDLDPVFAGAEDYYLTVDSPCVDSGDNDAPGLPTSDLEGEDRVQDGDGDTIATVDLGAYEFPAPTVTPTMTATPSATPTGTPVLTSTITATGTVVVTQTTTATPGLTETATATATGTVVATQTATATGTPIDTVSPTVTATATRTATDAPTQTVSATPTVSMLEIGLWMPDTHFDTGSSCRLDLEVLNPGAVHSVDLYILLDVLGDFWSYPSWVNVGQGLDFQNHVVAAGADETWPIIPEFTMPQVASFGPIFFYAAMFEEGTLSLDTLASNGSVYEFYLGP